MRARVGQAAPRVGHAARRVFLIVPTIALLLPASLAASAATVTPSASAATVTPGAEPPAAPSPVEVETTLPGGTSLRGRVDASLLDLRDRLRRLEAGLAEDDTAPIDSEFSIPLDRTAAIDARIPLLAIEIRQLEAQLAGLQRKAEALLRSAPAPEPDAARASDRDLADRRDDPVASEDDAKSAGAVPEALASDIVTTEVRLDVARARSAYLRGLSSRLAAAPELARTALVTLGAPRSSLRTRAEQSDALATALRGASERLSIVAARLEAGTLVGFVVEAQELARAMGDQSKALADAANEFAERAVAMKVLAARLEDEGSDVRSLYLRAASVAGTSQQVDRRFDALLQDQRQLRRRMRDSAGPQSDLARLRASADGLVPSPSMLGTTAEARRANDEAIALRSRVDDALTHNALDLEEWRLAWVNDAVALLATRISDEERARAYALSTEMISDLRSEAFAALGRARDGWRQTVRRIPAWPDVLDDDDAIDWLERVVVMLFAVFAGVAVRRRTGRGAVTAVKRLARWDPMRPHLGTLVRLAGLLQTVVPVAVLYPVYLVVDALLVSGSFAQDALAAVFHPFFLYFLARQILIGSTRQITRGRPALIPVTPETRDRLLTTYGRLGLVFAWAAAIDSVAVLVVGPGRIVALVDAVAALWIAVWAGWATWAWRSTLAEEWGRLAASAARPPEVALAGWMAESPLGFLISPLALLRIVVTFVAGAIAGQLSGTALASRLRAMFLRRRSRQVDDSDEARARKPEIPEEYLDEFPLYPLLEETDAVLVPRDALLDSILQQIDTWKESRTAGSTVLFGAKGIGKTTLAAMIARRLGDEQVVTHTLRGTMLSESDFVRVMASALGHPQAKDVAELAEALRDGPDRIVVLDEAHSIFLRVVGGYRAYDALVSLVNITSERVFWLLVFNRYTWKFLNESRSRTHYFRRVIELPAWTSAEIQDLIRRRTNRAGYKLSFSEVLRTDEIGTGGELDLIDGSDAYFRLLWESSAGNPRIATCLWLDSLTPIGDNQLEVGLFAEGTPKVLAALGDDLMFALAAIAQRENLSTEELSRTINLPLGFAEYAVRYLSENGLVEAKDQTSDRVTLSPRNYNAVVRILRNRHLLLE